MTTPISSKKPPRKRTVTMADGTKIETNDNVRSNLKKGRVVIHNIPKKKFSTETGIGYEDHKVKDDYDKTLAYPPPSKHPLFRKFWAETIENVVGRSNFNEAHLALLETFCRLRVELRSLDDFVNNGIRNY